MMSNSSKLKTAFGSLMFLSLLTLFYACDTMEDDAIPNGPTVTIDDSQVYLAPDGTTYIDLFSKVKTNGKISLNILSLPRKGTLTEIASGFLKYSPNQAFTSGRDGFTFTVLGNENQLLLTDSIE